MKRHKLYVEKILGTENKSEIEKLSHYHILRMADFQHERLIHLIVTSLVTIITVLFVLAGFITGNWVFLVLDLILIPLTFAYFLHYRSLENGVQELYRLTEKLYK